MITVAITLKHQGPWYIVGLPDWEDLARILNGRYYMDDKVWKIRLDIAGGPRIYDFELKQWMVVA